MERTTVMPLVSIFTCVYNRNHTMDRVFDSVRNQTYQNIEHIIVDDGSTDGVWSRIKQYAESSKYPVKIVQKNNGGKHTATNIAWDMAEGEYIIQLDSDDELLPDALTYLVGVWSDIPQKDLSQYWCVHGRCRTQHSEEMIGIPYPDKINEWNVQKAKDAAKQIDGEKIGLMKREILRNPKEEYRYPEPKGVKFVNEGVLWKPLNKKYRTWYTNKVVRIYYIDEGECLTKQSMSQQTITNRCWNSRWNLEHHKLYECNFLRDLVKYCLYYPLTSETYRKNNAYFLAGNKLTNLVLGIGYPFAYLIKPLLTRKLKIS